ncbi:MAG: hypothetical protein CMLOHMNK_03506 [Steroidobacteraceae bacterium]|nr:hypothetical protein [Steroidobacteraceae bacterium]
MYDVTVRDTPAAQVAPAAMRQALVRSTGQRDAATDPAFATLVADAQRYVRASRPGAQGGTDVVLDGNAIERAIVAAGRVPWPAERPFTLVVFEGVPDGAVLDAARSAVEAAATLRGLPVSVVPAAALDLAPGGLATRELLLPAAQRLGADAVLVGRGDGGASSIWQWTLSAPIVAESWAGTPAEAIHGAVDAFVRTTASPAMSNETDVIVMVTGVRDLAAYAGVTQALSRANAVQRVALEEAVGDTARFRVTLRGSADSLAASLAGDARLVPAAGGLPGMLSLAWLP